MATPVLLDHLGRPIQRQVLQQEVAAPTVTGVRQVMTGHPEVGLTPQRLARILREAEEGEPTRYLELAEAMEEKDLHYASVLGTRKRQVAQLPVKVVAADDSPEAQRQAEFLEAFLERDELQDELVDVLDATGKGYSCTEIVWDFSEGQWWPARLEWRDPRWFTFDREDGRTPLLREMGEPQPLAPFKWITHLAKAKSGLPIRGGLARLAAWMYLFKNYAVKDWISFIEVYGMPIRLGKYHAGASNEEKAILLSAVRNIGTDVGAIIPEGMVIEFVEAIGKGSSSIDLYDRFAAWADAQISKGVLGQNLTTEVKGGSYAAAQVHNDVRQDIETADAKQVSATLNRDLMRPAIDLNFGPQQSYPRLVVGREEEQDLRMLLAGVKTLVPLGARVSKSGMARAFGLPEAVDDQDLLTAPAGGPAVPPDGTDPALAKALAARQGDSAGGTGGDPGGDPGAGQVVLDPAAEAAMKAARPPIEGLVEQLKERLAAAGSWEEAQGALLELAQQASDPRLVETMREALVLAELQGMDAIASRKP
ncbi:Mu-like prophage protein gp29 [Tistlia consotensis]|uniref:Mu-like prophage protein gp29 n=1 Tax=Tistlia consotensis USBA 355 TaxID=560819 RepID=A0A1Y6CW45_9PROT|nr:DUF935 domain-containing protein [Tistlia consotensis]SMF82998.1 Mu-like prophage protein gp29 [Tistlia consotensis USBA 355]SNS31724.1 Mu-like prophage protein gp29 [Tistlia consotensis]